MAPELYQGDAYCIKCKMKKPMQNAYIKVSDSGRRMAVGECPDCGGKMNRILGKVDPSAEQVPVVTEPAEPRSTEPYEVITLPVYSEVTLGKPMGWYSVYGGEILGEPFGGPQPDMRTGYERLRDWFWKSLHTAAKNRNYCGEDDCC